MTLNIDLSHLTTALGTGTISLGAGTTATGSNVLSLSLDPLLDFSVGAGTTAVVGNTGASSVVDLGIDLGTGTSTSSGGLLEGLFGGGTASGTTGIIPGGTSGVGQTIIDLTGQLLGNSSGTSGGGSTPAQPSSPGLTITGTEGSDSLHGTAGNDTIKGLGGNDTIYGHGGNDVVDGGTGTDTFVTTGSLSQYTAASENGMIAIQNKATGEIDYLANVERIQFTDNKVLALDFNGHAGEAYRLYQAALDRAPDAAGLNFHVSWLDNGTSLHDDAANFLASTEFQQKYGTNLTDAQYVNELYNNTLHRGPDAAGAAYWNNQLSSHTQDRASVLIGFSESAENHQQTDHQLQNGILLDHGIA